MHMMHANAFTSDFFFGRILSPDLIWSDTSKILMIPFRLNPIQMINHFPEMSALCRKDFLGHHLNSLREILPDEFDFAPRTWVLPNDLEGKEI